MHDKCLKNVLNGVYPNGEVDQMTSKNLILFVDKLLEFLANMGLGSKSHKLKAINYNNDNIWRKKLIMKCVTFFSKCPVNELKELSTLRNGFSNKENIDNNSFQNGSGCAFKKEPVAPVKKKRGRKKKVPVLKKLLVPLVRLQLPEKVRQKQKVKKIDKIGFLNYFGLNRTENSLKKEVSCFDGKYYPKSYRLISNPHIPFSSSLGRVMVQKERYVMSEYLKIKRQERLEWNLSTSNIQNVNDNIEYPVTYVPSVAGGSETDFCHVYKFGKRTNSEDSTTNCKRLSVRLKPIINVKHSPDVAVNINRLSPEMIKDANGGKKFHVDIKKVQCRRNLSIQLTDIYKNMKKKKNL